MDCINRRSKSKSKDVILLLYGLIVYSYKELVGANQTQGTAGLITLSSEAYCCPGQGPVHRTARMIISLFFQWRKWNESCRLSSSLHFLPRDTIQNYVITVSLGLYPNPGKATAVNWSSAWEVSTVGKNKASTGLAGGLCFFHTFVDCSSLLC